ncbi:hypothetical protein WA026_009061 [Henosepilachna vigintioctopunctata]|uniref:LAGLIDADG homing endonuclease n=1 Tax=Henosepilachna vigintioctopunctata TaxID=420089 RepID=A0AAW1UXU5_9CUCU
MHCEGVIKLVSNEQFDGERRQNSFVNTYRCVHFCLKGNGISTLDVKYGDNTISSSQTTKFLGIYVDRNLRWTSHIDVLCKKLSTSFIVISRIKNIVPRNCVMNVYYSLVYSHLNYNILLWGCSTEISRVFITQKRILRLIFNIHQRTSCTPIFINNYIITLPCLYIYRCLLYVKENEYRFPKLNSNHE